MADKAGYRGDAKYASGGDSSLRTTNYLKTEDRFAGRQFKQGGGRNDEEWGKGSSKANPKPADKSEKPVKPRNLNSTKFGKPGVPE